MKKKLKNLFSFVAALVVVITSINLTGFVDTASAATTVNVTYNGSVTYGPTTLGDFSINGKRAYCITNDKSTPYGNVSMNTSAVSNNTILKILYYGYDSGIKPWSGFNGMAKAYGICVTSKALSNAYSSTSIGIASDFMNYVNSQPAIPTSAAFTVKQGSADANGKSYTATASGNTQTTPAFTYTATSAANTTTFTVPTSTTAYVTHNGTRTSYVADRSVTLYSGDSFYFTAASGVSATRTVKFTGSEAMTATLYTPVNSSLQTLIVGNAVSAKTASLNIVFKDVKGSMKLTKKDTSTGVGLSGAVYSVYYNKTSYPVISVSTDSNLTDGCYTNSVTGTNSGNLVATFTTTGGGAGVPALGGYGSYLNGAGGENITVAGNTLDNLPSGYYSIVETKAPAGYSISTTVIKKQISASNTSNVITVSATDTKTGSTSVSLKKFSEDESKTGETYSLAGAKYKIYAFPSGPSLGKFMGPISQHNGILDGNSGIGISSHFNSDGSISLSWFESIADFEYIGEFTVDANGIGRVSDVANTIHLANAYKAWGRNTNATAITNLPVDGTDINPGNGLTMTDMPYYYYAIETKLPDSGAYDWDQHVIYMYEGGEITSIEPISANDPIRITINKQDSEGNVIDAENTGLSLEGTVFKISYYDGYYDSKTSLPASTTRTWYVKTSYNPISKKVETQLEEAYLSNDYLSDAFYYDELGVPTIPLGTVTIEEVRAADGFVLNSGTVKDDNGNAYSDRMFIGQVKIDSSINGARLYGINSISATGLVAYTNELNLNITNDVQRGNVNFSKLRYDTNGKMANVEFDISLLGIDDEGNEVVVETHGVKTDSDGNYDSANDSSLIFYGTGDSSKWNPSTIDASRGKLIYGTYLIQEIKCDANVGYVLAEPVRISISADSQTVDAGTFINIPNPSIKTKEWDSDTKTHLTMADENITIVDTVTYSYLAGNAAYTVKGILMEIKDDGSVIPLLDDNGKIIVAHTFFNTEMPVTPNTAEGTVDVTYNFSGKSSAGKKFVIYEYLFTEASDVNQNTITDLTVSNGVPVTDGVIVDNDGKMVAHEDKNDADQIGYIPKIKTTAKDSISGTHEGNAGKSTTIIDTVTYEGLKHGIEYTIKGTLMNKADGKELLDANGKTITQSKTFTPSSASGSIDISFTFDASLLEGKTTVAFETLYYNNIEVAVHADINDNDQTVHFPKVGTTARDAESGIQTAIYKNSVSIIDKVDYSNLIVGNSYYVQGTLMDKATGKPVKINGENITAKSDVFKPTATNGSIEITFTFDATKAGLFDSDGTLHDVVVFETLYDVDNHVLDTEEDLNNEDQTISFILPVKILKTDTDGNPLKNASLEVIDSNGNTVASLTTDGTVQEAYLHIGEYTLREVAAPKGYAIAVDIPFEVKSDGKVYVNGVQTEAVIMEDMRLVALPLVGGNGTLLLSITSLFTLFSAIGIAVFIKKKESI